TKPSQKKIQKKFHHAVVMWSLRAAAQLFKCKVNCKIVERSRHWLVNLKGGPQKLVTLSGKQSGERCLGQEQPQFAPCANLRPVAEVIEERLGRAVEPLVWIKNVCARIALLVPMMQRVGDNHLHAIR